MTVPSTPGIAGTFGTLTGKELVEITPAATGPVSTNATVQTTSAAIGQLGAGAVQPAAFGAKGDTQAVTGAITSKANVAAVHIAGANFTNADIGKVFCCSALALATTISAVYGPQDIATATATSNTLAASVGTAVYGTDDSAALNTMFAAIRARPVTTPAPPLGNAIGDGISIVSPNGVTYMVYATGLNMTALQLVIWEGNGATVYGACAGDAVIDTSEGLVNLNNLFVFGDPVATPLIGVATGRVTITGHATLTGYRLICNGYFTLASLYNRGAELSTFFNCKFTNGQAGSVTTGGYGYIGDGINHWNYISPWMNTTHPVNYAVTFNGNSFYSCTFTGTGAGSSAIWLAECREHSWYNSYIYAALNGVVLYTQQFAFVTENNYLSFDLHMEGIVNAFFFTSPSTTILLVGLTYRDAACQATGAIFASDVGITEVLVTSLIANVFITNSIAPGNATWFDNPALYNLQGSVVGTNAQGFSLPSVMVGSVAIQSQGNPALGLDYVNPTYYGFGAAGSSTFAGAVSIEGAVMISNGAVSALNVNFGGGWTAPTYPTLTFSAPGGAGTTASATVIAMGWNGNGTILSGSGGYSKNDALTLLGGSSTQSASLAVTSIDASGNILSYVGNHGGFYSNLGASSTFSLGGGTGGGATISFPQFSINQGTQSTSISVAGSQYLIPPTVTSSTTSQTVPPAIAPVMGNMIQTNPATGVINVGLPFTYGAVSGPKALITGSGSPNGSVTASTGSMYVSMTGGTSSTLYLKQSGLGWNGWANVA